MVKNYINFLQFLLFFVFLTVLSPKIYSQCAGTDGSVTICNVEDISNRTIPLFSYLGGSPTPGGTWSDDNGSKGLSVSTGILNGQAIRAGGTYQYTYTAPGTGCTNNTAKVFVTIGAFEGYPAPYATKCSDENTYNLFSAFNSTVISPHTNGVWTNSLGQVVPQLITITYMKGNYQFTYTVPPVPGCDTAPLSTSIILTVFRAPVSGTGRDLTLCGTTDLDTYTAFDLRTLLSGQDPGGLWSGMGVTSSSNPIVDLKQVFAVNGPGTYTYNYTVLSEDDNCPNKSTSIAITLEKRLDFTGSKIEIEKDICENQIATAVYTATITQGAEAIPDAEYKVTFNVSGPNGGTETIQAFFVNGKLSFPLRSSYFRQVGIFYVTVTGIVDVTSKGTCSNIIDDLSTDLEIRTLPYLEGAILTPEPTCQNKSALVQLTNALRLADGNYTIRYNISGDNSALGQTANIRVVGGNSNFSIPGSLNIKSGVSIITITNITNNETGCTNTATIRGDLIINPLPNAATVTVLVNDYCLNDPVKVTVSGLGTLTDVTISYMLLDSNLSSLETIILPVSNGKTEFILPSGLLLNTGSTIISLTNLKNNSTNCDINLNSVLDSFIIHPIPAPPIVNPQPFCKVDEAAVANLVPNGNQYKWYNSPTATTPLASTSILESGNYFVRETSPAGCTSEPAMVLVTVNDSPAPELNADGQNFCGLNSPTIADLSNHTNASSTVVWYDAETNGNLLAASTPLIEQGEYYGFNFPSSDCFSSEYIKVTVTLTNCDNVPNDFFIPDGFSPNGDGINDSFVIKDIEFLYPNYTLEIFNRYGNGMYKGDNNKPAWDGMNYEKRGIAGGVAPNGVYFYVLHFNKDNKPPKQGRLYLNR
ncbi:gliding motility-associated-like protein [Flavobacterium sp. HSC-32F16]|uniref:gliding motility-associated C-terminal domain-containing protein n=1 Tax=Flavobacterium sp. HSC-32F16 TaxID=2910964 RepID=UPI0020A55257|nr:gliding motility-associated C-terminal domain-containing protein [Flavobacterium sp. HSC-32F16]MCP2027208.1 gliding motility-associated-like protein [Flavobacterium sp. HSC-32F16]